MKLKFQIIDNTRSGFARYCPTFAKAFDCLIDKILQNHINILSDLLRIPNIPTGHDAAKGLAIAAIDKKTRDKAISALTEALKDNDREVRNRAVWALRVAARNGVDIAIVPVVDLLKDNDINTRSHIARVLEDAAREDTYETRRAIVAAIMGLLNSKEFGAEVQKNSPLYITLIGYISEIIRAVQITEDGAEASV